MYNLRAREREREELVLGGYIALGGLVARLKNLSINSLDHDDDDAWVEPAREDQTTHPSPTL